MERGDRGRDRTGDWTEFDLQDTVTDLSNGWAIKRVETAESIRQTEIPRREVNATRVFDSGKTPYALYFNLQSWAG